MDVGGAAGSGSPRRFDLADRDWVPVGGARQHLNLLTGPGPRITLPQQLLSKPSSVWLQRSPHERRQHIDHDTLLSSMEKQASTNSPDYAALAYTDGLSHSAIRAHSGIIRRSA